MRVVLDTNILISATFWNGDSEKIVTMAENGEIELILSKGILDEFSAVLDYKEIQDKIKNKNLEMKRSVEKISSIAKLVVPSRKLKIVKDDPDDDKILECALEGNADFIISNNWHLLSLKSFLGISIIKPNEFLGILLRKTK